MLGGSSIHSSLTFVLISPADSHPSNLIVPLILHSPWFHASFLNGISKKKHSLEHSKIRTNVSESQHAKIDNEEIISW